MNKLIIATLAVSLSGCFIVSKQPRTNNRSQAASAPEYKNHGQQRSEEVHERNAERKAEHDAAKGKK